MHRRVITPESCSDIPLEEGESFRIDYLTALFIVRKKYILQSGIKRLGYFWSVLEPVLGAMVFVWIFTIIRASEPNWILSVFIGFGMIGGFNTGVRYSMSPRVDEGGLRIERVRARALVLSRIMGMFLDSIFASSGVVLACLLMGADPIGVILLPFLNFLLAISTFSIFSILTPLALKIPDIVPIVNLTGMVMFFGSPVLYPLSLTTGLHRELNLYNPLCYFMEPIRLLTGAGEDIDLLIPEFALFLAIFFPISIALSLPKIDKLRWGVSSWS